MSTFPDAQFIWIRKRDRVKNRYLAFQRTFRLAELPSTAILRISAYSHYQVAINGMVLGRGPDPSNNEYYYYDEYDAAKCLRRGRNTITVLAYAFGPELPWPETSYLPGEHGWLLFELECRFRNGHVRQIGSDSSCRVRIADAWKRQTSGYTELRAGYKEYYDAGKFGYDALEPGKTSGQAWRRAVELTAADMTYAYTFRRKDIKSFNHPERYPAAAYCIDGGFAYGFTKTRGWQIENPGALIPDYPVDGYYDVVWKGEPNFPKRRVEADASNACVVHHDPGCGKPSLWIDFGGMQYGELVLELETTSAGSIVDIGYGESPTITYIDRYITGAGRREFRPFHYRAGRYVLLTFSKIAAPIRIHAVTFRRCDYAVDTNPNPFAAAPGDLTRIARTAERTLHLNMHSHFEDCPWREQKLYLGDMHLEALGCYYSWGEYAYVAKNLRQLAARKRDDGWMRSGPGFSLGQGGLIDFPVYFPLEVRDYTLFSGDRTTLKALYPHAVRILENYMDMGVRDNGLIDIGKADTFQNWCFINWNDVVKKGQCAALNFLFARGLAAAADMATWLNRTEDSARFRKMLSALRKTIDEAFWDPGKGLYQDSRFKGKPIKHYSVETNALALLSGLPAAQKKRGILRALTTGQLNLETPTAFFNAYVAESLLLNYRTKAALHLIEHYWGQMLQRGTDVFWELFLPQTPPGSHPPKGISLCHGFSSGPAYLLPAYILGIRPLQPGFRTFTVDPQLSTVDHASGAIPTPHGYITARYASGVLRIEHPPETEPVPSKKLRIPAGVKIATHRRYVRRCARDNSRLSGSPA